MTPSDVIYEILRETRTTQEQLRIKMGYKTQGTVSNRLKRGSMNMTTFVKMLEVLGYEIVVRPVGMPGPETTVTNE